MTPDVPLVPEMPGMTAEMDDDEGENVDMDTALMHALRPEVTLHTPLSASVSVSEETGEDESNYDYPESDKRTESSSSIGGGEVPPLFGSIEGIEPVSTASTASQLPPYPFSQTLTMTQMEGDVEEEALIDEVPAQTAKNWSFLHSTYLNHLNIIIKCPLQHCKPFPNFVAIRWRWKFPLHPNKASKAPQHLLIAQGNIYDFSLWPFI